MRSACTHIKHDRTNHQQPPATPPRCHCHTTHPHHHAIDIFVVVVVVVCDPYTAGTPSSTVKWTIFCRLKCRCVIARTGRGRLLVVPASSVRAHAAMASDNFTDTCVGMIYAMQSNEWLRRGCTHELSSTASKKSFVGSSKAQRAYSVRAARRGRKPFIPPTRREISLCANSGCTHVWMPWMVI